MIEEDIKKILICREAIDKHNNRKQIDGKMVLTGETLKASVGVYMSVLVDNGFNTVADFSIENDRICFELWCDCYPVGGECDFCGEKEITDQPCAQLFGAENVCIKESRKLSNNILRIAFQRWKDGVVAPPIDGVYSSFCRKGHGFYRLVEDEKELPLGLVSDFLRWTI